MKKLVYILMFMPFIVLGQTKTENYVKNTTYKVKTKTGSVASDNKQESITYYDGLGRPKQSVAVRAGGQKQDIVTHIEYDGLGRQVKEYLPYAVSSNNGAIKTGDIANNTNQFYKNKYPEDFAGVSLPNVNAYSEKVFDNSPLNRVLEQGAPGKDWKFGNGHTIKFDYQANINNEVLDFGVNFSGNNTEAPNLKIATSYYKPSQLYKTITKNENWNRWDYKDKTTEEFKNKQGQVVLKRTYDNQKPHDTYYVYDDFGNLTYVLPPLASEKTIIYETGMKTYPASTFVTGGNATGSIKLGIEKTAPGQYKYVADIDLHNLANSNFKSGEIMDLPYFYPSMSNFWLGSASASVSSNGSYAYKYVSYYVTNGKLFCYVYEYNRNNLPLEFSSFDRITKSSLPQNLQGFSEAASEAKIKELLDKLCYQYKYDDKNRLIEKKIPGKGWEYIIYDKLDRPVLTQDANQRVNNKKQWLFTKYDDFERVAYTGIYTHNSKLTQKQMQQHFNTAPTQGGAKKLYESRQSQEFGSSDVQHHYSNVQFPYNNTEILTVNYYENYNFNRAGASTSVTSYGIPSTNNTKGLATGSKVKVLDENKWITTVNYYDKKARPIKVYSKNEFLNTIDIVESQLDFTGKVLQTNTIHKKTGKTDIKTSDKFKYDHADRLVSQKQKINSQAEELIVKNNYDELGQLVKKEVGNTEASPLQEVDYTYNVRGWLKKINQPENGLGNDLFAFELLYNDRGGNLSNNKLYNGNISQTIWRTANDNKSRYYNYYYDDLNRIRSSYYYSWGQSSRFSSNYSYDKNGNIQRLYRRGAIVENPDAKVANHYGTMDYLNYTYDGNKLLNVNDTGNKDYGFKNGNNEGFIGDYYYDANGNMTRDYNKNINKITYNHLNLPTQVNFSAGKFIDYIYDASGTKIQKKVRDLNNLTTTDYAGNYMYKDNNLQFFNTPEGYATPNNSGEFDYIYQYKDHLGNVRLSYADTNNDGEINPENEIIEEKNYYPFGLKHKGYNNVVSSNGNSTAQKFGYNGKELNEELGLEWHDYGARNYDASIGRWMNIDPLAEDYLSYSTYNYTLNDPIRNIDPDGRGVSDVILEGDEKDLAFSELQASVGDQLTLSMDTDGKVTYTQNGNGPLSEGASKLTTAIDDHSVIATVNATDNLVSSKTGSLLQGEFQGSTLTNNVDPSSGKNIVNAEQEMNVNVLKRADDVKNTPGENVLHEVLESYKGGVINQEKNIGVVPVATIGGKNTVYNIAHKWAPGGQAADEVQYDKNRPAVGQIKYNSKTVGRLKIKGITIQTYPVKM